MNTNENNNNNGTSLMDVLSGREAFKVEFSIEYLSIIYIVIAVFVVGIALIAVSKSWPGK